MPKTTFRFLSAAFMTLLLAAPLWAQSTATLQGTVTDAQGAIVPGASVTATNEATGVQRAVITDSAGHYQMAALPGGSYRLDARLTGFQPKVVNGVVLGVAQTVVLNVQLGVSGVAEEVAVTAEAPVIESATDFGGPGDRPAHRAGDPPQRAPLRGPRAAHPGLGGPQPDRLPDRAPPGPGVVRVQHGRATAKTP